MDSITTAVTTALGTVQTQGMSMIGDVLPFALGIAGALVVVRLGWKAFKSISGK